MAKKDETVNQLLINMLEKVMKSNIDANVYGAVAKESLDTLISIDLTLKNTRSSFKVLESTLKTVNASINKISFVAGSGAGDKMSEKAKSDSATSKNDGKKLDDLKYLKKFHDVIKATTKGEEKNDSTPSSSSNQDSKTNSKKSVSLSKKEPAPKKQAMGDKMIFAALKVAQNIEKVKNMNVKLQNEAYKAVVSIHARFSLLKSDVEGKPLGLQVKAYGVETLNMIKETKKSISKHPVVLKLKENSAKLSNVRKNILSKPMIMKLKTDITGVKSKIKALSGLFKNMNPFGPLGNILTQIGGSAIDYFKGKLKGSLKDSVQENKGMMNQLKKFDGALKRVDDVVGKVMKNLFSSIFESGGESALGGIVGIFENIVTFLEANEPMISGVISSLVTGIAGGISGLMVFLQPAFQFIGTLFESFKTWITTMKDTIAELMPVIKEKMAIVMDWLGPKIGFIAEVFKFLFDKWIEAWPSILETLQEVWGKIEPIFVTFAGIVDDVFLILEKVFNFVKDKWPIFEKTISTVGGVVKKVFETLVGVISEAYGFLGKIFDKVMDLLGLEKDENSPSDVMMGTLSEEKQKEISNTYNQYASGRLSEKTNGSYEAETMAKEKGMLHGNATGIQYVPYDNYLTKLHQGERVLTANENNQLSRGGLGGKSVVVNIPKLAENINASSPVDVDNFLGLLEDRIVGVAMNMG